MSIRTLDPLGWRSVHFQQLTLQDLGAGTPARICSVHRSAQRVQRRYKRRE